MTLTFDLYPDLVLIPPCDVADNTQECSLVHNLNVLYLQSPVTVSLKAVPFQSPLPILRPAEKPSCSFFQAVNYLAPCSYHLSSGTGEPKNLQSKRTRLPSVTFIYSFLDPKIRGVASIYKKKKKKESENTVCDLARILIPWLFYWLVLLGV